MSQITRTYATIAAANKYWRLVSKDQDISVAGSVLVRELIDMDATTVDALDALIVAETTFSSPTADGQTYTGTFSNSNNKIIGQNDRAVTMRNTITKVDTFSVTTSANIAIALANMTYRKTRENEILQLFDFSTGEGDELACIFSNLSSASADEVKCMETVTDADLVTRLATGYTYADRKWKHEENGTATFIVLFRKIAYDSWLTRTGETVGETTTFDWDTAETAADTLVKRNEGRDTEERTRTWMLIQSADWSDAITDLWGATESGYSVIAVNPTSNGQGGFNIEQVIAKQVAIVSAAVVAGEGEDPDTQPVSGTLQESEVINPHGFNSGTMARVTSRYVYYATAGFPTEVAPDDYTLTNSPKDIDMGNGLFRREYVYEKPTWTTWANGLTPDKIEYPNVSGDASRIVKTWTGIAKALKTTAIAALKDGTGTYAADINYIITDAQYADANNGSITLVQQLVAGKVWIDDITPDKTEYPNVAGDAARIVKTWTGIRVVFKTTATNALKTGTGTYAADSGYIITDARHSDNNNGTITLVQQLVKGRAWTDSDGQNTYDEVYKLEPVGRVDDDPPVIVRTKVWHRITNATRVAAVAQLWEDMGPTYFVDWVKQSNNGDGTHDIIQQSSYVKKNSQMTWTESSYTRRNFTKTKGVVTGWSYTARVSYCRKVYRSSEKDALTYSVGASSTSVTKITEHAWAVVGKSTLTTSGYGP